MTCDVSTWHAFDSRRLVGSAMENVLASQLSLMFRKSAAGDYLEIVTMAIKGGGSSDLLIRRRELLRAITGQVLVRPVFMSSFAGDKLLSWLVRCCCTDPTPASNTAAASSSPSSSAPGWATAHGALAPMEVLFVLAACSSPRSRQAVL